MGKKYKVRKFVYDEFEWEDPGKEFSNEDVLGQVAAFIPALAGGKIKQTDEGDYVKVEFGPKPKRLG